MEIKGENYKLWDEGKGVGIIWIPLSVSYLSVAL